MKYKIEKGDTFKCLKTFKMETGEKAYIRSKEYLSERDNCITDDYEIDVNHDMANLDDFFEYFKLLQK